MKIIVFVFTLLATSAVLADSTIYQREDKFSGITHYFTDSRDVDLEGGSFFSRRYVKFDFHAIKPTSPAVRAPYTLSVTMETPDWVFISAGASLLVKLDGKEMISFAGNGGRNYRKVLWAEHLVESADYPLTLDQLNHIGQAKTVEFRVVGDKQDITGSWKRDLIDDAVFFAQKAPALIAASQATRVELAVSNKSSQIVTPLKLGISFVSVTRPVADALKMPSEKGVIVVEVTSDSVAERAGIRQGDVILDFNHQQIMSTEELQFAVSKISQGDNISAKVWRDGSESKMDFKF